MWRWERRRSVIYQSTLQTMSVCLPAVRQEITAALHNSKGWPTHHVRRPWEVRHSVTYCWTIREGLQKIVLMHLLLLRCPWGDFATSVDGRRQVNWADRPWLNRFQLANGITSVKTLRMVLKTWTTPIDGILFCRLLLKESSSYSN